MKIVSLGWLHIVKSQRNLSRWCCICIRMMFTGPSKARNWKCASRLLTSPSFPASSLCASWRASLVECSCLVFTCQCLCHHCSQGPQRCSSAGWANPVCWVVVGFCFFSSFAKVRIEKHRKHRLWVQAWSVYCLWSIYSIYRLTGHELLENEGKRECF